MTFQIGKNVDVYSFADQYQNADFPKYAMIFSDVVRPLIHPELNLEVPPLGIADCKIRSYEQLHRLVHNMRAIADLNGYAQICKIDMEEPGQQPETVGTPDEAPEEDASAFIKVDPPPPEVVLKKDEEEELPENVARAIEAIQDDNEEPTAPKRRGRKPKNIEE